MRRTVVALTMLLTLFVAPMAKAEKLTAREAKEAAFESALRTKGMMPHRFGSLVCDRTSATAFNCRLKMRAETRWALKDCTFVTEVVKKQQIKVRVRSRRCEKTNEAFLSRGDAWRTMHRVADSRYRSDENWSGGVSYGRVSTTKYEFQIEWRTERESCFQMIKVALVDGKPKGSASDAACSTVPSWPKSAD